MKNFWQVFQGIFIALASIGLLLGGFSLSLAEGNSLATATATASFTSTSVPTPTPTLVPTSSPTWQVFTPSAFTTPLPDSPTPFPTWTPTLTITQPPTPANCPPPFGWLVYFVQPGETLDSIAARYRISTAELQSANCLLTTELIPGVVIYVTPMRTQTPLPCGAPVNWVVYYVQPGDTLFRLGQAYGISVAELQRANCLGTSTLLHNGQILYVPPWLPRPALPTSPMIIFPTSTPVNPPPAVPTFTSIPTDTPIPVATDAPVEVPTDTPISSSP
jgi:LysM repeat protein